MNPRAAGWHAAILSVLLTMLLSNCAGEPKPTLRQVNVTEYFLVEAGFRKWEVNMEAPKRQALLNSLPRGKIVTYQRDGQTYHAYADEAAQTLYVGDEAAYQRYQAIARGRQLCERVDATESTAFWRCFDEFPKAGGR